MGQTRTWQSNTTLWQKIDCAQQGLRCAFTDKSFRYVSLNALSFLLIFLPLAPTWQSKAFYFYLILSQLTMEVINTAFETTINRISLDDHDLSRQVKDMAAGASLWNQSVALGSQIIGGIGIMLSIHAWRLANPTAGWGAYVWSTFTS
jgi:diacylglycerol kinase (ATP)